MHGEGRRRYLHRWLPLGALRAAGCTLREWGWLQIQRLPRDDVDGGRSKLRHYFTNLRQLQARCVIKGVRRQSQFILICKIFRNAI